MFSIKPENTCDYLIIGAGIIGLTLALELKKRDRAAKVIIIEKEPHAGMHASGRNSGVLHTGIYYGNNTLKAKSCALGARRMKAFATEHAIPFKQSGKVIIATSDADLSTIDSLMNNAKENGIRAERLGADAIRYIEPHASVHGAGIYCPDTAVIDSKSVVQKLFEVLLQEGVEFKFGLPVLNINPQTKKVQTKTQTYQYGYLFNCAGANADRIAKNFELGTQYSLIPFKGIYYQLRPEKAHLVSNNIYPVPDLRLPFLGVHLTRVMNGDVYVGPTAIPALGRENYGVIKGIKCKEGFSVTKNLLGMYFSNQNNFKLLVHMELKKYIKSHFLASARKLVNELKADDLMPTKKVGIRPQLVNTRTKTLEMDYIIEQTPYSSHVLNAISPAFTCAFAFAELLVDRSLV